MSEEETEEVTNNIIAVTIFLGTVLCVAGLFEALPHAVLSICSNSVLILLVTMIAGLIEISSSHSNNGFNNLLESFEVSPEGIQLIFLPPLIFSEMFKSNSHVFFGVLFQTSTLAFAGVCVSSILTALFPLYILPESWSWYLSIAFGGMLSATDPVAVLAALHELGASTKLSTIIGGESVLNDGAAIVIVTLFLNLESGEYYSTGDIFGFIFQEILGSLSLGVAFGLIQILCYYILRDKPTPLVSFTFALPYICFGCALYGNMSGVLALVSLGLIANIFGKIFIIGAVAHRMEAFWEQMEFIANSWLFGISGLLIADDLINGNLEGTDWGYLFLLYILLLAIRFVSIILFLPIMGKVGYGITFKECLMTWWGGLRGAVGLTLALTVRSVALEENEPRIASLATFFMAGIVVLTSLLNASTTGVFLKLLKLENLPNPKVMFELKKAFRQSAVASLRFAGASTSEISQQIVPVEKVSSGSPDDKTGSAALHASRRHFLLAQRSTYDKLLARRIISGYSWLLLKQSVDHELDIFDEEIDQWRNIIDLSQVRFVTWIVSTYGSPVEKEIIAHLSKTGEIEISTNALIENNVSAFKKKAIQSCLRLLAFLAYSYLHAHDQGRKAILALKSEDDNLKHERERLIEESLAACEHPSHYLQNIKKFRPDILESLKSFQLSTSIKWTLYDRIFDLYDLGLIERTETTELFGYTKRICTQASKLKLPLQENYKFTVHGEFDKNPDLYPFPALKPDQNSLTKINSKNTAMTEEGQVQLALDDSVVVQVNESADQSMIREMSSLSVAGDIGLLVSETGIDLTSRTPDDITERMISDIQNNNI